MTELTDLVTVFRSGDPDRSISLQVAKELLTSAGMEVHEFGPDAGLETAELRVPGADSARAEDILRAEEEAIDLDEPDDSHFLDMVDVFSAEDVNAPLDALNLQSALEANGITAVLEQSMPLPALRVSVMVPREHEVRAREIIAELQNPTS